MASITTRTGKGSPLTHVEVDNNFTNLNTAKLEAGAIALGSAGTPSISFTGDTNTGIFSNGADQLSITTAGVQRFKVGPNGHVALGEGSTITDFNFLNIQGSNLTHTVGVVLNKTDATAQIWAMRNTGPLTFYNYTANTAALTITTGGLVGIGTTSPSAKLDVVGSHATNLSSLFLRNTSATNTATTLSFYSYINYNGGITGAGSEISAETTFATDTGTSQMVFKTTSNITYLGPQEKMRLDASGRLLVGTSTNSKNLRGEMSAAIVGVGANTSAGLGITGYCSSNSGAFPLLDIQRSRGVTDGSMTVVASGDKLGSLSFRGADGTNFITAASIEGEVDGTPGANDMPGRLVFSTTADGGSSPTERMRITSSGCLKVSNDNAYTNIDLLAHGVRQSITANWAWIAVNATASPFGMSIIYSGAAPDNTGNPFIDCSDTAGTRFSIKSNGGIYNYSANNTNLSDRNAKKDISLAANTWNCIKEWEIVNYRYKDQPADADLNLGVIAQQVAESCPEVITVFEKATDDQPEKLGIKEQQMYWMAIKALQEAMGRIEALETEVALLKAA